MLLYSLEDSIGWNAGIVLWQISVVLVGSEVVSEQAVSECSNPDGRHFVVEENIMDVVTQRRYFVEKVNLPCGSVEDIQSAVLRGNPKCSRHRFNDFADGFSSQVVVAVAWFNPVEQFVFLRQHVDTAEVGTHPDVSVAVAKDIVHSIVVELVFVDEVLTDNFN